MPKLNQKTLEKRFQCHFCNDTFRTRQGLSGHIHFKHDTGAIIKEKSPMETAAEIMQMEAYLHSIGQSKDQIENFTGVQKDWEFVKIYMKDSDLKIGPKDYRMFQIASYAIRASEKRLKTWLSNELAGAITKMMELNTEIAAKIIQKQ